MSVFLKLTVVDWAAASIEFQELWVSAGVRDTYSSPRFYSLVQEVTSSYRDINRLMRKSSASSVLSKLVNMELTIDVLHHLRSTIRPSTQPVESRTKELDAADGHAKK